MPDVLHWLGIQKIDTLCSMSDMKHDVRPRSRAVASLRLTGDTQAIVGSGITVDVRRDLPEHLIPPDSRVEIDAKIAAGCTSCPFASLEMSTESSDRFLCLEDGDQGRSRQDRRAWL